MSSIALSPNAAGTAIFTVAAPGTSTNRTITLPDQTGTLATSADVSAAQSAAVTSALASDIGVSQTWQSFTGSRVVGTTYQNTTARPIMVLISLTRTSTGSGNVQASVDGTTWVTVCEIPTGATGAGQSEISLIVPVGHRYRLQQTAASLTIQSWAELL